MLVSLFCASLFPVHLWHHHAEAEHNLAKHQHLNTAQHHCELDELLCEQQPAVDCNHPFHISSPKHKCVSCTYHFTKHFIPIEEVQTERISHAVLNQYAPITDQLRKAITRISNKGPPVV